jgi:hypothetical protein
VRRYALNQSLRLICSLVLATEAVASVVNIEDQRNDDTQGASITASGGIDGSKGTTDRRNVNIDLRIDYNSDLWKRFVIASGAYRTKNNESFVDKRFYHLRAMRNIKGAMSVEGFYQRSEDPYRLLKQRSLVGLGVRIAPQSYWRLGASLMHETQSSTTREEEKALRANLYLHFRRGIAENIDILTTAYLQPRLDGSISDHLATLQSSLQFTVNEWFLINVSIEYDHDETPPEGASRDELSWGTNFSLRF